MPTIDSVILSLLPQSSLPGFYKALIKNMLPNLGEPEKQEIYVSLKNSYEDRSSLAEEKEEFLTKYEHIAGQIEDRPQEVVELHEFAEKNEKEKITVGKSDAKLGMMKQKMDLAALKEQLKKHSSGK